MQIDSNSVDFFHYDERVIEKDFSSIRRNIWLAHS